MKNVMNKFGAAVLIFCTVFLLFSCGGDQIVKNGIQLTDEKTVFSEETEKKSKDLFFSLLEGAYLGESAVIPPAKAKELGEISGRIWEITTDYAISESKYLTVIDGISKNKDSFTSIISGKDRGIEVFKKAYASLAAGGSTEYAGYTLYHLLSFSLEYRYNQKMERYEKYGYSYLYDEACEIKGQLDSLQKEIGEKNFSLAVGVGIMASELFFGGAFGDGASEMFSDTEILIMLRRVEIEALDVGKDGYEFLLELAVPDSVDENSAAADRILYCAALNSDVKKLAAATKIIESLAVSAQKNLSAEDAGLIREGRFKELLQRIFSKFGDGEWEAFSEMTSADFNYDGYEGIFREIYGEDFEIYCSSLPQSVTADELRASVGGDDFTEKLEGYLAGKSPVLTYRIFK